jgi:hypothetical protein
MWGNSLGWGISALIVAVTIGALVYVSRTLNTISDPTDFSTKSGAVDAVSTPEPPAGALPDSDGAGNSVALYHQAIDLYEQNRTLFDRFADKHDRPDLAAVEPAMELLRDAAGKTSLGIFAATPSEAVSYESNTPLKALRTLGNCATGAGLLEKFSGDKEKAVGDLQAAFSLGQRMADERLCYAELSDGLGLMGGSAIELSEMVKADGDQAKADTLNHFAISLSDYTNDKLVPIETVLSSIDQSIVERNAGDLLWLAKNSKERMWRVEAIHAVGRLKYNAGRPGDNRGAARVVTEIARTDSDPAIKTAAEQARDLTIDQYDMLH